MALSLGEKRSLAGLNSGITTLAKQIRVADIQTMSEFEGLFPVNPAVLRQITDRMKQTGYDQSQPIHIWKEQGVLIDGHTRRLAAIEAGLVSIPVYEHSFASIDEAMEYALSIQVARRNLSDGELITAVEKLDALKKRGRKAENSTEEEQETGKSAEKLANLLGTSTRKIEKIRSITKDGDDDVKEAVKAGEISIANAYQQTRNKELAKKEAFLNLNPELKKKVEEHKEIVQKTLFQIIKLYSADELSVWLENVQKEAVQGKSRTQTEWLDELKQFRIEGGE